MAVSELPAAEPRPTAPLLAGWKRHGLVTPVICLLLGVSMAVPYMVAAGYGDLREHTVPFEWAFFSTFLLYGGATLIALRLPDLSPRLMAVVFGVALLLNGILFWTRPTLSDDMYRYVWDGRVQAQGISPYRYSPDAPELEALRDETIWQYINRKNVITVYPPAAELAYLLIWRIAPDSVLAFQVAMVAGALGAGGLLVGLLRTMGNSTARVVIFLWSPLLIYETAHAAHLDGLVLPLLVGAWWARVREKDTLVGVLLGLATALKLYPLILFPALWRPTHPAGRWRMPFAFGITMLLCYLPYYLQSGNGVLGYLPNYFNERFNLGLAGMLIPLFKEWGIDPNRGILLLTIGVLAVITLAMLIRPAADGITAVRRSVWLIGAFTILTQNLFSWYMLWLLPLLALFLEPDARWGIGPGAWLGWWLFCGLVALSYTFFIAWRPVPWALAAQFIPLYALLGVELIRRGVRQRRMGYAAS